MSMTAGTSEDPLTQWQGLSMSTLAAHLTRIGRIDFDEHPASLFRFARELGKEGRPRGIGNALGKTMILGHGLHLQVFHTDKPISIDDLAACLMGEVLTPPGNPLMHASHDFAMLASLWSAFSSLRKKRGFSIFSPVERVPRCPSPKEGTRLLSPWLKPGALRRGLVKIYANCERHTSK